MSTETQRVDVLHVMREASAVLIRDGHKAIPEDLLNAHDAMAELIEAARSLEAILDAHTEWEDGCCYYNGLATPELEGPMQAMADALERVGGAA